MDFSDTPGEAVFRAEARAFLDANAVLKSEHSRTSGSRAFNAEDVALSKAWQGKKAEAGFAGFHWPKKYGGREGTQMQAIIFAQEEEKYLVPPGIFNQGVGMALPTIMSCGTQAQIDRYARPALFGEEVWCQLFSEPAAGSDLAGLRTRVARDGDDWVVNGQKVWTSNAHFSQFAMLVARSNQDAETSGADIFHSRHGGAGRGGAADQTDFRHLEFLRGISYRCAHSRFAAPRRRGRWLESGDDDAGQ